MVHLIQVGSHREKSPVKEESIEIFSLADFSNSWFGFSVFMLGFLCPVRFAGFLQFSLWFSVLVSHDGFFSEFFSHAFYSFPLFFFLRKLHPAVLQKLHFGARLTSRTTRAAFC